MAAKLFFVSLYTVKHQRLTRQYVRLLDEHTDISLDFPLLQVKDFTLKQTDKLASYRQYCQVIRMRKKLNL
jgi:hypothetical protein